MKIAIGLDLGGTNISAGAIAENGEVLNLEKVKTEAQKGKDFVLEKIKQIISSRIDSAKKKNWEISGIGIGSPGPLNIEKGIIFKMPNLPGWQNVSIIEILEDEFPYSIKLNNDANCALLAEHWIGSAKGVENCLGLTLGTGIGGGIIADNKLYTGASGGAGELGHMIIDQNGPICGCGQKGCLESFVGGANFLKKARKEGDFKEVEEIFQKARDGEENAQKLIDYYAHYLGLGLANLINIFNPEMIILGGQVIKSAEQFLEKTKEMAQKLSFESSFADCEIVLAKLGDKAGLIGAARLIL